LLDMLVDICAHQTHNEKARRAQLIGIRRAEVMKIYG